MNSNPVVEISNRREPSGRRLNANRANAQKSAGPTTPEGKAISSRNALVHGLCAATFLIETEDPAEFNAVRGCYYTRFGPRDQVENDLAGKIVHAIWNEKRAWAMEHETNQSPDGENGPGLRIRIHRDLVHRPRRLGVRRMSYSGH